MEDKNYEKRQNVYVIETAMDNRFAEEIARDAAQQIVDLFDRLGEEQDCKNTSKIG